MANLPKPLLGLLLGTAAFFAIWMVALKPSASSSGAGSEGAAGQYQPAIDQAHHAVTTSNQANAKLGAPTATVTAAKPTTAAEARTTAKATTTANPTTTAKAAKPATSRQSSAASGVKSVKDAIRAGKVVAVLFYNPAAADDQAMKQELATAPGHGGKVVKLAVPVAQLTDYGVITQQVPVVTAPTLVLIDAAHHATTITGYADPVELAQRISDALAAK